MTIKELPHKNERNDLQDAGLKLKALMDSMPDFVLFKDGEGRWIEANAFALNVFQLDKAAYKGKKDTELVPPDHFYHDALKACEASDQDAWQRDGTWRGVEIIPRPDGGAFIFDVIKVPSFHPDGSRKALTIVGRDITEKKLVEDQAQILNSAIESSLGAVAMADPEGKVTYVNPACVRLWGYNDKKEMIGRPVPDFWGNPENAKRIHEAVIQGKTESNERVGKKKNGTLFDVLISVGLVRDTAGTPQCTVLSAVDITQRKRAEQALNERMVALTQPLDNAEGLQFSDLFNIEDIQRLQDQFANATGVASIITAPDGTPITRPSNFTRLCSEVIRGTEKGRCNCFKSDAALGRQDPSGPIVQPCLSGGLWDGGASISVDGKHIANWLIGQVRNEAQDEEQMLRYADEIGADREVFRQALEEVPVISKERFAQIAQALFTLAGELSSRAYLNVQQARFINEHKQAEEALRRSEDRLEEAMDQARIAYWEWDAASNTFTFNDRFYALYRTTAEREGGYRMPSEVYAREFLPPEEQHLVSKSIAKVLSGETADLQLEHLIRRRDGELRHIVVRINVVLDDKGCVMGTRGSNQDITDLKRAEEAMRESEERYRSFFDQASDGILLMSLAGKQIDLNKAYAQMHGYTVQEMIGLEVKDLSDPDTLSLFPDRVSRLNEGHTLNFDVLHYHKDGHLFPIEVSSRLVLFNGQYCIQSICRDITVRKQMERLLKQSEKKTHHLNELLKAMYDIQRLIRTEPDEGKLLDSVCHIFVETRGYLAAWVGVPQPDSKQVVAVAHAGRTNRILKEAPITWDDTPNGHGPCGTAVREWAPCVISDIATDPRFEPWRKEALAAGCGSVASFPILTEKRLWGVLTIKSKQPNAFSEEEIQLLTDLASEVGQAMQNIHHRIERKRMEEAQRQAQKMVAVGQLAGGVAHDFNNILGANMLQIGLLMERPDLAPEMRRALEELKQGTFRATNLTRQLLMFSRKQAVQMKTLDMKTALESVQGMLSRLLGENIFINLQTAVEPIWVKADQGMIEQVIVNLCVNARDAMPNGGKLTLRAEKLEIKAGSDPVHLDVHPGRFICLSVADTGTGISPEDIKHIFEPFYTTKEVGKGTGLGLATVHGIVQQHEGWIEVESKVGEGTVFRVYLPALAQEQATAAEDKIKQVPRGRETILLVEDDAMLLRSVISGLQLLGYRVVEAVDGADALLKWQEHSEEIDLMLTDMVMPGGMSGLELAHKIQSTRPGLKVIISSGYSEELIDLNPELYPGITLLPKPYGIPALARTIRQCLDASAVPNPVSKQP